MKRKFLLTVLLLVLGLGCSKDNSTTTNTTSTATSESRNLLLSGEFDNEDVYVVFTNEDAEYNSSDTIYVASNNSTATTLNASTVSSNKTYTNNDILDLRTKENELFEISKEIEKPSNIISKSVISASTTKTLEEVGDEVTFNTIIITSSGGEKDATTSATLIKQVTPTSGEDRTLNIWLATDLIDKDSEYMNSYSIDTLADSFLKEGTNNDIYEYITSIYGTEWYGSNDNIEYGFIGATKTIDILLYDINEGYDSLYGVVLGFYYALNNYEIPDEDSAYYAYYNSLKNSNERIMFNLDATLLKKNSSDIISTLGHEFVHTCNFYQKNILNGVSMDNWLNEMLAMMGEDLLADKLGVPGPRGITDITSTMPTDDEKADSIGRFYVYNSGTTNSLPINDQDGNFNVNNYSQTYAYGAYLLRNMIEDEGDLSFIKNIVNNVKGDHEAIEYALNVAGIDKTFEETVQDFSKATLLSNNKFTGNEMYKYNIGKTFVQDGVKFKIGPINVHNYTKYDIPGFVTYGTNYYNAPDLDYGGVQYFKLGKGLTGDKSFELYVPAGVAYQVIVKDSDGTYDEDKSKEVEDSIEEVE